MLQSPTIHVRASNFSCSWTLWSTSVRCCSRYYPFPVLYASPAWWGYANLGDRKRLNSIVKKLSRSGFLPADEPSFDNHCTSADSALFRSVLSNPCHILHSLLPPRKNNPYYMRSRPHDRTLPRVDVFTKRNVIMRMLYDFI